MQAASVSSPASRVIHRLRSLAARTLSFDREVQSREMLAPKREAADRNLERERSDLADARCAASYVWPWKKRYDSTGRTSIVAVIKMVRAWIIKVDCLFHEAQPEHVRVKCGVLSRLRGDRSKVMDASQVHVNRA
jgi:hypothetical protein